MRTLPKLFVGLLALFLPALPTPARAKEKAVPAGVNQAPEKVAGKKLAQWIKELYSFDPGVRENAVRTLLEFGPDARKAAPDVIRMVARDRDISPRVNAVIVLMHMEIRNSDVPAAVRALARRLTDDPDSVVRFHAALALGRFEEMAKASIPSLVSATRDQRSWEIRKAAVGSLGKVAVEKNNKKKGPDPRATQALLYALRDGTGRVRLEAVMVLGAMGPPANLTTKAAVMRALHGRLTDRYKPVVVWARVSMMALENQVTEAHLKAIAGMLNSGDVETRTHAARSFGQMGGYSEKEHRALVKAHIPDLVSALKDGEPRVATMACWALGQLGRKFDPGDRATAALTALSKGKKVDARIRNMALAALASIKGAKDMQELKDYKPKDKDKDKVKTKP